MADRDQLLDAAERCFTRQGPRRTRHRDVAEEAGVSRPTLYKYLGDRDAITRALLDRELDRFMAAVRNHVLGFETMYDRFVEALVFTTQYAKGHALFQRLLADEPDLTLPWLTTNAEAVLARAVDALAPHLAAAMERGEFRRVDARVAAEWMARLAISLITTPSITAPLDRPQTLRRFVRDLFAVGLVSSAGVTR